MPIPKNDSKILHEWKEIFAGKIAAGLRKYRIYHHIGEVYGVSYGTVRYHLDPKYRARQLYADHKRYRKWRREKIYNRNYCRLTRNPEKFMAKIFESTDRASLAHIAATLPEFTEGIYFGPPTISRLLHRYVYEARGPPYLEEVGPSHYRLRDTTV